jgi:hypothetical protein
MAVADTGIAPSCVTRTVDFRLLKSAVMHEATISKCVAPAGVTICRAASNAGIWTPATPALRFIKVLIARGRTEASAVLRCSSTPCSKPKSPSSTRRCPRPFTVSVCNTCIINPVIRLISPRPLTPTNNPLSALCNTPLAAPARANSEAFSRDRWNFGSFLKRLPSTPAFMRAKYSPSIL